MEHLKARRSPTIRKISWKPAERDFRAHGRFDGRAHSKSLQLWLDKNRNVLLALDSAALAAIEAVLLTFVHRITARSGFAIPRHFLPFRSRAISATMAAQF